MVSFIQSHAILTKTLVIVALIVESDNYMIDRGEQSDSFR